jgi:hypothetical protein
MAKEVTKEKDEVEVTMTKAQKEKFVAMVSEEVEAAKPIELVGLNLGVEHRINGVAYGPGYCDAPSNIAGLLESHDAAAVDSRLREMTSSDNLVEILGRGVVRRVKRMG